MNPITAPSFALLNRPVCPYDPIKPDKTKWALLGLLLGAGLGFGLIYLLELTDSSFRNEDQLEAAFEYPVLGSITRILTEDDIHKQHQQRLTIIIIVAVGLLFLFGGGIFVAIKLGYDFGPAIQSMAEFVYNIKQSIESFLSKVKQVFV